MNANRLSAVLFVVGTLIARTSGASADSLPTVRLVPAFPNLTFERPLFLTHANDGSGRLFVVEQAGRILAFPDSPSVASATVYLDIRAKVRRAHEEEGLLALAFHPRYRENGYFYVYYSASNPLRSVLSRFRVAKNDPRRADPQSETVLLQIPKPYGNHNGSTLVFGPDGYLYISIGDGGSAGDPHGNGQNLGSLLAKILRIDVDRADSGLAYAIPRDNPFVNRRGARGEVWAWGLRNVWRMSFDRLTGALWAADVGQDEWEEIDIIVKGGNYGWNLREGKHKYADGVAKDSLIDPIFEYSHDVGASITGGYVYRGARLKRLIGAYIFADYITGNLYALRYEGGKVTEHRLILEQPRNVSSFGEGPDGEVYVVCFDGRVYRMEEE